jgi:ketosteroid isomerase-like protein
METPKTTRELLETYYEGFARKQGWEEVLSEDFTFTGGDMTQPTPVVGKQAYIQIIQRYARLFQTMQVKEMIVEGERACVIERYDYLFPNGKAITGEVATLWKVNDHKLSALTIFFDTLTFHRNAQ